jgi:hypothetical protein
VPKSSMRPTKSLPVIDIASLRGGSGDLNRTSAALDRAGAEFGSTWSATAYASASLISKSSKKAPTGFEG